MQQESVKKSLPISEPVWNRCWDVLLEMLEDRSWTAITPTSTVATMYQQYCCAKSLVILVLLANKPLTSGNHCAYCVGEQGCRLSIFVCLSGNFTSPAMQHIETLRHGVGHVMVLFQDKVTATLREDFFKNQNYEIELKHFSQLYVNVSRHRLVPPHRLLGPSEETELLGVLRCTKEKIPSILVTDPVVRYYNFPIGSIIEIRRPAFYYRRVISALAKSNYEKFFSV